MQSTRSPRAAVGHPRYGSGKGTGRTPLLHVASLKARIVRRQMRANRRGTPLACPPPAAWPISPRRRLTLWTVLPTRLRPRPCSQIPHDANGLADFLTLTDRRFGI